MSSNVKAGLEDKDKDKDEPKDQYAKTTTEAKSFHPRLQSFVPITFNDRKMDSVSDYRIIFYGFEHEACNTIYITAFYNIHEYFKPFKSNASLECEDIEIDSRIKQVTPRMMAMLMQCIFITLRHNHQDESLSNIINEIYKLFNDTALTLSAKNIYLAITLDDLIKEDYWPFQKIINFLLSASGSNEHCIENDISDQNDSEILEEYLQYSLALERIHDKKLSTFLHAKIMYKLIILRIKAYKQGQDALTNYEITYKRLLDRHSEMTFGAGILLVVSEKHYDKHNNPVTFEIKWLIKLFNLMGMPNIIIHHSSETPLLKYYPLSFILIDKHITENIDKTDPTKLLWHFSGGCPQCAQQASQYKDNGVIIKKIPIIMKIDDIEAPIPVLFQGIVPFSVNVSDLTSRTLKQLKEICLLYACNKINTSNLDYGSIREKLKLLGHDIGQK